MTRIMLVDDDPNTLLVLDHLLSRNEGFRIEAFADPEQALAKIHEQPFDIIISDYRMPIVDGIDLLETAWRVAPHTTRILLSGVADSQVLTSSINRCRIDHFIEKPWHSEELVKLVEQAAEEQATTKEERKILELFSNRKQALCLAAFAEKAHLQLPASQKCLTHAPSCLENIRQAMQAALAILGFELLHYSSAIRDEVGSSDLSRKAAVEFGNLEHLVTEVRQHPCIRDLQAACHTIFDDAIIKQNNPLYGSWDSLFMSIACRINKRERFDTFLAGLKEQLAENNIRNGYFFSCIENKRHTVAFLSSSHHHSEPLCKQDAATIRELIHLCNKAISQAYNCHICHKAITLVDYQQYRLTEKQKQILTCFLHSSNATLKSVANSQRVSIDAINFHLRNIRAALKKPRTSPLALAILARDMNLI